MRAIRKNLARTFSYACVAVSLGCTQVGDDDPVDAPATDGLPDFDILLGDLTRVDGGVEVSDLKLIADHEGYDNQPHFAPDGRSLLYTSERNGQTDIYRYDLIEKTTSPVAVTPEGEYSATWIPGEDSYSVIRQDSDSLQRLWAFRSDGSAPRVILEDVHPVGYHAWGDANTIAMFILGDPATLQVANLETGTVESVEADIGRSIHRIPGRHAISFVHKESEADWVIKALDLDSEAIDVLTNTRPGSEDYAWTPDGSIVMGEGSVLYNWLPDRGWIEVADLSVGGVNDISRLAVDASGSRIAIVIQ